MGRPFRDRRPAADDSAMTVAVTGAAGFVGRHVVRRLEALGVSPTVVIRPGSRLPDDLGAQVVVEMDTADAPPDAFERLGSPEMLIHLAWDGLPNYGSARHLDEELPAQRSFLGAILEAGLGALTVAGTCLEYGLQSGALREDATTAPVTAYGKAKDALRAHLEGIQRTRPFRLTWARLFYLHGEGQAPGALVPQLEAAMARGDATFDMSGGEQLRDYLPVEEAAADLVALALHGRRQRRRERLFRSTDIGPRACRGCGAKPWVHDLPEPWTLPLSRIRADGLLGRSRPSSITVWGVTDDIVRRRGQGSDRGERAEHHVPRGSCGVHARIHPAQVLVQLLVAGAADHPVPAGHRGHAGTGLVGAAGPRCSRPASRTAARSSCGPRCWS